jgi:probable DNA metabolism protein
LRSVSHCEIESAQRKAAEAAAADRGDSDVRAVLEAAYKVRHEIHRLMGLLRFCPDAQGIYIAQCEPDHFVLPALGPYFYERFGETPWVIIDKKRRQRLSCTSGGQPEFLGMDDCPDMQNQSGDWENLWRNYHRTINNENRNNPALQRQFMPKRYWNYLNELK